MKNPRMLGAVVALGLLSAGLGNALISNTRIDDRKEAAWRQNSKGAPPLPRNKKLAASAAEAKRQRKNAKRLKDRTLALV